MVEQHILEELVDTRMPFGKYKGFYVYQVPEHYLVWYQQKGFPNGRLGMILSTMYEIRLNGLEYLLKPIIQKQRN